jgi:hypothetical protein
VPISYQRIEVRVECNKETMHAFAYEAVKKELGLFPSINYMELMEGAVRENNFSKKYIKYLASFKRE